MTAPIMFSITSNISKCLPEINSLCHSSAKANSGDRHTDVTAHKSIPTFLKQATTSANSTACTAYKNRCAAFLINKCTALYSAELAESPKIRRVINADMPPLAFTVCVPFCEDSVSIRIIHMTDKAAQIISLLPLFICIIRLNLLLFIVAKRLTPDLAMRQSLPLL